MQCLNCSKEVDQTGNRPRKYCSDKCRMVHVRSLRKSKAYSKPNNEGGVLAETNKNVDSSECSRQSKISVDLTFAVSYKHYVDNPDMYARRDNPEKLNWGQPLTFHELQASPFTANRVSIPGDWDFKEAV